jgi:hypothetical protein
MTNKWNQKRKKKEMKKDITKTYWNWKKEKIETKWNEKRKITIKWNEKEKKKKSNWSSTKKKKKNEMKNAITSWWQEASIIIFTTFTSILSQNVQMLTFTDVLCFQEGFMQCGMAKSLPIMLCKATWLASLAHYPNIMCKGLDHSTDYVIFLTTLYDITFWWWSYTCS